VSFLFVTNFVTIQIGFGKQDSTEAKIVSWECVLFYSGDRATVNPSKIDSGRSASFCSI